MKQKIVGFHLDSENHWVANLACGHKQHVRHDPPMVERQWVLSEDERQKRIGTSLNCKRCDEVGLVVAQAIQKACLQAVAEAYMDASYAGMCKESQLDLIFDRLMALNLQLLSQQAIAQSTTDLGTLS